MRKVLVCSLWAVLIGATPLSYPIGDLHFLVGKWSCSFAMGSQRGVYTAAFNTALGGAGLIEVDAWKGGGGDTAVYSYDRSNHRLNVTVVEENGQTTVFLGPPGTAGRIAYRSVYPDTSADELFQRVTASEYTLDFRQNRLGKTIVSKDVCVRIGSKP